jgi:hypothetical protein
VLNVILFYCSYIGFLLLVSGTEVFCFDSCLSDLTIHLFGQRQLPLYSSNLMTFFFFFGQHFFFGSTFSGAPRKETLPNFGEPVRPCVQLSQNCKFKFFLFHFIEILLKSTNTNIQIFRIIFLYFEFLAIF